MQSQAIPASLEYSLRTMIEIVPGVRVTEITDRIPDGQRILFDRMRIEHEAPLLVTFEGWAPSLHRSTHTVHIPTRHVEMTSTISNPKPEMRSRPKTQDEILANAHSKLANLIEDNIRRAAHAAREGIEKPLPHPASIDHVRTRNLDHIHIAKPMLAHILQYDPKVAKRILAQALMFSFSALKGVDPVVNDEPGMTRADVVEMDDGKGPLMRITLHLDKLVLFDGTRVILRQELPELVRMAAVGRPVGNVVETGSAAIDKSIVTRVEYDDGEDTAMQLSSNAVPMTILHVDAPTVLLGSALPKRRDVHI